MNDKNNNDDLSCRREVRFKGKDSDINPECGINNFEDDFGITITNDEEDPNSNYCINTEQKIKDTRTGLTIDQKTEIHTLINNLKSQIKQFRYKYEYLKYFYHGNKISDAKLEKTLEIYTGRLSKFSKDSLMVFGSETIYTIGLHIKKNALFNFLTNKAKIKIFQIIDEILLIWKDKRNKGIPTSQRARLITDIISYFQNMIKRPVYESTISSIIFKGIDTNPSKILKFIRSRVVQKDQINLQRTMELIYYSAILTPDLIYERSDHKFQVSNSDIEIFAKKVRERITQQILTSGFLTTIKGVEIVVQIDANMLEILIETIFAYSNNYKKVISMWDISSTFMYDLLRCITPGIIVFKNLEDKLISLPDDKRFYSKNKALDLIYEILPFINERRKTDISSLAHTIIGQIFTEFLTVKNGLKAFYEIILDYDRTDVYRQYRIDGLIHRNKQFTNLIEEESHIKYLNHYPRLSEYVVYITIDYTSSVNLYEVILPKLEKNYAGGNRHLIIVLFSSERNQHIENIRKVVSSEANKKDIEVTVLTIEEFQSYLNVGDKVKKEIAKVLKLMNTAISNSMSNSNSFNTLFKRSKNAKIIIENILVNGMGVTQFYYNKYLGKI